MKVNAVHALVTLLAQQTALKGSAADRGVKLQVLNELLTETKDARQRLISLERLLRDANIIGETDHLDGTLGNFPRSKISDLTQWKAASATLDAINKQKAQISGRLWDGGEDEVHPPVPGRVTADSADGDAVRTSAQPQPANPSGAPGAQQAYNPYAASAALFGVAEKFEPTLDDIEKALHTLGVPPLDPRLRRHIEDDINASQRELINSKFRFLLVAGGMAILLAVVLSLAN